MRSTFKEIRKETNLYRKKCTKVLDYGKELLNNVKELNQKDITSTRAKNYLDVLEKSLTILNENIIDFLTEELDELLIKNSEEIENDKLKEKFTPKAQRKSMAERRQMPRYRKRQTLYFRVPGKPDQYSGFSHDLGPTGLFLTTNHLSVSIGQSIWINLDHPKENNIDILGLVVWKKWVPPLMRSMEKGGFGIKIVYAPENWFSLFSESDIVEEIEPKTEKS